MRVFVAAALVLPFALYAILALTRRRRYRSLASKLGATHIGAGWFAPGRIAGDGFEIEATKVGKSFCTEVRMAAGSTPGTFFLQREFFGEEPDWKFVRVSAPGKERVFLWEVAVTRHVEPSEQQRDSLLRWLRRGAQFSSIRASLTAARVRRMLIAEGFVSTSFNGIVTSLARLQHTLDAFRQLVPDGGVLAARKRA